MPAETTSHELAAAAAAADDDDDELKEAVPAPAKLVDHRSTKRGNKIARVPAAVKLLNVDGETEPPENEDHASAMLLVMKSSHQLRLHALQLQLQQQQSILAANDQQVLQQQQQGSVLHTINLNSEFESQSILASSGPLAKDPPKHEGEKRRLSAPSGRRQELQQVMESRAFSNVDTEEGKQQAQNMEAQAFSSVEECSGSTKSPVVMTEDLVQWGNAAFCGASSWQLTSCETSSSSRTNLHNIACQQIDDELQQSVRERSAEINGQISLHGEEHGHSVPKAKKRIATEAYMPDKCGICTTASAVSGLRSPPIVFSNGHCDASELHDHEQDKRESSMGSTLSDQESSCELARAAQCKTSQWVDEEEPLNSLKSSDPAHQSYVTSPSSSSISLSAAVAADLHVLSSTDEQSLILEKNDEARIRAELELEIERDLQKELETKILLLNKRLEQLHSLQAKRCFKEDHHVTHSPSALGSNEVAEVKPSSNEGDQLLEEEVQASASIPENHEGGRAPISEQDRIMIQPYLMNKKLAYTNPASMKMIDGQLPGNAIHFSHTTSPVVAWRKLASAAVSGAALPAWESSAARSEGKHISIWPMPATQAFNSPLRTALEECQQGNLSRSTTMKIKGKLQLATSLAARKQKFDWISTLRTGVVSATPVLASIKEASPPPKAARAEVHDDASNTLPHTTAQVISGVPSPGNAQYSTPHVIKKQLSSDENAKMKGEGTQYHTPSVSKEGHNPHYHVPLVLKEGHHGPSLSEEAGHINNGHHQHGSSIIAKEAQNNVGNSGAAAAMHHDPGLAITEKGEEVSSKSASEKHHIATSVSSKIMTANFFAHTASSRRKEVVKHTTPAQSKACHTGNKSKVSTTQNNKQVMISSTISKGKKTMEKWSC